MPYYSTLVTSDFDALSNDEFEFLLNDPPGDKVKNILVLYRRDNDDSLEFAQYYAALYGLDDLQLVPVPCSGSEILDSYEDFYDQIEEPLLLYMDSIRDEYGVLDVKYILVGFGVSGGFINNGHTIATASRLSRIMHEFTEQTSNPLYSRKTYAEYSDDDIEIAFIVSRIDAPTLAIAKSVVDNTKLTIRQKSLNGTFFFDRFSSLSTDGDETYDEDLQDFENTTLPLMNMTTSKTTFWDEYTDVVTPRLQNDSVMWSWSSDRAGYSFFKDKTTARFFLYNADIDGAGAMRDEEDKRWPVLALTRGYATTAGSMSDPTSDGYLRPRPFFEALIRGATVGEAYMYSCPFLDWTVTLIGDPLVTVKFPKGGTISNALTEFRGWDEMKNKVSDAIGFTIARENAVLDSYNQLLQTTDMSVKVEVLPALQRLAQNVTESTVPNFSPLLTQMVAFPNRGGSNINAFLESNDYKVSSLWNTILGNNTNIISSANQHTTGEWFIEFELLHPDAFFTFYHFQLELSLFADFGPSFSTLQSFEDIEGWSYEKELGVFEPIVALGVPSNYAGRRIRFTAKADDYLDRGTVFYARYFQKNSFAETSDYSIQKMVVSS